MCFEIFSGGGGGGARQSLVTKDDENGAVRLALRARLNGRDIRSACPIF